MPAGLGKGIFLKKRSSQVFYPFKAYPLYTIPLPRSGKGARINVVLLNLVINDPVAYLQIAGGLQHIAMRMLQGVNEQFLFEARHRIVERQRRPGCPQTSGGIGASERRAGRDRRNLVRRASCTGPALRHCRPRVLQKKFLCRCRNALHCAPQGLGGRLEEHIRQRKDVFRTFAQRRQGNGKHGDTIVQIFEKGTLGDSFSKSADDEQMKRTSTPTGCPPPMRTTDCSCKTCRICAWMDRESLSMSSMNSVLQLASSNSPLRV